MNLYEVNGRALIAAEPKDAIKAYDEIFRVDVIEAITCKLLRAGPGPVHRRPERILKGRELIGSAYPLRRREACL